MAAFSSSAFSTDAFNQNAFDFGAVVAAVTTAPGRVLYEEKRKKVKKRRIRGESGELLDDSIAAKIAEFLPDDDLEAASEYAEETEIIIPDDALAALFKLRDDKTGPEDKALLDDEFILMIAAIA